MSSEEDLDLLAQSYVLGELSDAATTEFEVRLADDQDAREAVARAVAVAEALVDRAAAPVVPLRVRRPWARVATAAAALIVLALGFVVARGEAPAGAPANEDLIASWIAFGATDLDAIDEVDAIDLDLSDSTDTPSWLMTALEDDR